jgi:hypothetical protein
VGGAIGALAGGMLFDAVGTYGWLWTGVLALSILAGLLVFSLKNHPDSDHPDGRSYAPVPVEADR